MQFKLSASSWGMWSMFCNTWVVPAHLLVPWANGASAGISWKVQVVVMALSTLSMHFASTLIVLGHLMVEMGSDCMAEMHWEVQVVVMAHSWGDNVFRNFLHWMEQEDRGWADKHIHAYANIGGPVLGVPKSIGSLLSGNPRGLVLRNFGPCSCPVCLVLSTSASCPFMTYCQCSRRLLEGRDIAEGTMKQMRVILMSNIASPTPFPPLHPSQMFLGPFPVGWECPQTLAVTL